MKAFKHLKIPLLLFTAAIASFTATDAQDTLSFTLKQAQEYAVENSIDNKNARLDVEAAKKKVWETTAIGLPQISAKLDYQYILELPESDPSAFGDMFSPIYGSIGNIHNYLDGQGDYSNPDFENVTAASQESSDEEGLSFFNEQSLSYGVTVSQLVFSGEYIVGLQASRTYLQLSKNLEEQSELDTKESVASSYFAVKTFESSLQYLINMRSNMDSMVYEMRAMVNEGLIEKTEADQIELTAKNIKTQLNTLDRQREVMYKLLKIQMGIDFETHIALTENLDELIEAYDIDKLTDVQFNPEVNTTYKSVQTNVASQELLHKQQKSQYLPQVAAFYSFSGIDYLGETPPAFETNIPQMVGASVSIPIFSSGQRNAQVAQAKIEVEKARNLEQQTTQSLQMLFLQAKYDVNDALDNYYTTKYSLALSETIYGNNKIKFKEGMASSLDLSQANNQYLDALSKYSQATMKLLNAKIALNKLVNNL